jgi:AraC-like DNA-binding protein
VVSGTFGYRAASGRALLHPGAVLLGNAGTCYECGHEHGRGDRCIAVQLAPALFEEIAAFTAGTARFRFTAPMLPSGPVLARTLVALEAASAGTATSMEELVLAAVERVVAASAGVTLRCEPCPATDERRVTRALRLIEARAEETLGLDTLAAEAGMSRYHFLRRFRRVTGRTPYRYLLDLRLRRAALRLRLTRESVATVAFDTGFGDLSTFNAQFREAFGQAPQAWRRLAFLPVARRHHVGQSGS